MKKVLSFILSAAIAASSMVVPVFAQTTEEAGRDYIINHDYSTAEYDTVEEVFGTGRYWLDSIGTGSSDEYSNADIEYKVENGELIAHVKNTGAFGHLEVDLSDENGNSQTGKIWVEYKINLKSPKKLLVQPMNNGSITTTTYYQGTNWNAVSTAASNNDPQSGAQTNWGQALADGGKTYTMKALYNTDERKVEEFYCNGNDVSDKVGDYFRQNATGINKLKFLDNADTQFTQAADVYDLSYIKVWKEPEAPIDEDQIKADEDAEAINSALILGSQLPNSVNADINLVKEGPVNGSQITWTAAPSGIVDPATGAVSDVTEAADVTLTATVNYNGKTAQKEIKITVIPKGSVNKYVYEEDFEYATVEDMYKIQGITATNSPFSMLGLSMKNGTMLSFKQATTPKASEGIFLNFNELAYRLNGEHYVEIKVKKDNPRANWQLKFYPENVKVGTEFITMDASNTNLSWRLSSGWTGAPSVKITDTNDVVVRVLLDFDKQVISEVYVDDGSGAAVDGIQTSISGSSDGKTVPFMGTAESLGGLAIWANNNMADGSSFDVDYVRVWDSEKAKVRADMEALTLADITSENPASITQNVTMPAKGKVNGTEFTWTSSNTAAIALDGKVTRPQSGDAAVVLTASAEIDGETFEKKFYLNVSGITGGGVDDFEFDYDVYNNVFTEIGSEIVPSTPETIEISGEKLVVKSQAAEASAKINLTNEDGSFGLSGRTAVEFDASANGGGAVYDIVSTDGSTMASAVVTSSEYTINTRDNSFTVPYREGDNLKLRFVFDIENDTVQVWHNNMEITGAALHPVTANKNVSSLKMTVSGGSSASIDNLKASIRSDARLQTVYNALTFDLIKGDNTSPTEVRYDLDLFTEYMLGSVISWNSGDASTINPETGAVTRPQDGDKEVTISAKISLKDSEESKTKDFTLRVKQFSANNLAQEKPVKASVSASNGTSADNITDGSYDTAFRTVGNERSFNVTIDLEKAEQISGLSIYEELINDKYAINKYEIKVSDDNKNWTTVYDNGTTVGESKNVDFKPVTARYVRFEVIGKELGSPVGIREIEVRFDPTDSNRVDADTEDLVLDSAYTVTSDITLPTKGEYGSTIEWTSSHPNIISAEGKYTRPATDTVVTLTAVIKSGNVTKEKKFTKLAKGNSSGGGGTSGGSTRPSGSGGSTGMPYIPSASPEPVPTAKPKRFTDLGTVPWAEEYIYELENAGIVNGVSENLFDPDRGINREEAVKLIVRAFNIKPNGSGVSFNDVDKNDWYNEFIEAAYEAGVVKGISGDVFGVGTKITREDFAVMITRAIEFKGIEITGDLNNDKLDGVSDYAKEAMAMLFDEGIMTGDEYGRLNPKNETSRAQSAKIISMAMKLR